MTRRSKAKARNQHEHASRRAIQRFGIILDHDDAIAQIRDGRAEFIERQSCRVTIWRIVQQDQKIVVVYDKNRGTIVTCMNGWQAEQESA